MPVTKTAKRALRGSQRKEGVNKVIISRLEVAVRRAQKIKTLKEVTVAVSLADRAVKKAVIHKNKAARIKSQLSKLLTEKKAVIEKKPAKKKKTSKK